MRCSLKSCLKVKAIPPECDPDYILLQDEESCFKDLFKINISQADSQQPGKSVMLWAINVISHAMGHCH